MTRDEAIKWVDDRMCWGRGTFTKNHPPNIDECWEAGRMAIKALKSDRPTGRWLCSDDSYENAVCSNCGFDSGESYVVVKYEQKWKACPMCEARMKGEDSETD